MARPATFDLDNLTDAGLSVVERDGWSAVSIRSVAECLDVSPMALYRLAADARQLRRVIADAAAGPIQPEHDGGDLSEAMRTWAHRAYRHLGRYRRLASYVIPE